MWDTPRLSNFFYAISKQGFIINRVLNYEPAFNDYIELKIE